MKERHEVAIRIFEEADSPHEAARLAFAKLLSPETRPRRLEVSRTIYHCGKRHRSRSSFRNTIRLAVYLSSSKTRRSVAVIVERASS